MGSILSCRNDDETLNWPKTTVALGVTAAALTIAYLAARRFGQNSAPVTILPVNPPKPIPVPKPIPPVVPMPKPVVTEPPRFLGPPVREFKIDLADDLIQGWRGDPMQALRDIEKQVLARQESSVLYTLRRGRDRLRFRVMVKPQAVEVSCTGPLCTLRERFLKIIEEMTSCHRPELSFVRS